MLYQGQIEVLVGNTVGVRVPFAHEESSLLRHPDERGESLWGFRVTHRALPVTSNSPVPCATVHILAIPESPAKWGSSGSHPDQNGISSSTVSASTSLGIHSTGQPSGHSILTGCVFAASFSACRLARHAARAAIA